MVKRTKSKKQKRISPSEAARIVGCSAGHIRLLIRTKKLKAMKKLSDEPGRAITYWILESEAIKLRDNPPSKERGGWPRGRPRNTGSEDGS